MTSQSALITYIIIYQNDLQVNVYNILKIISIELARLKKLHNSVWKITFFMKKNSEMLLRRIKRFNY